ncbi:MAG: glycosyltransferase family 4 protein [Methanobacteriaceae archaeon]|nr:glycosyltransferase family 4 protein [Methanobacteriaceae archaeon]
MNILLINYMETTAPGGINKVVREIAKNLSKTHEITVIQPNPFDLPAKEVYNGFQIIRIKSRYGKYIYDLNPEIYFYLKNNLKILNPDIIHVHGYHTLFSFEVIYTIKRTIPNVPIIISPHYGIFSHDTIAGKYLWNIHNLIGRKILKYSDTILAASNFEARNLNVDLNISKYKITIISHGVDNIDLKNKKDNKSPIKLLYVGYLLELKGVQYILETLKELKKRNVEAHLTIIGEGPYEKNLKKLANKLNLNGLIKWQGFIHDKQNNELLKYFKESDIFLLLSKSENYGIVVAESLAMGTPVIVTKRTALVEFLDESGCYGVDFPPVPIEVANLILEICEKNIAIDENSTKIRNWSKVSINYEKMYLNLLREAKNAN